MNALSKDRAWVAPGRLRVQADLVAVPVLVLSRSGRIRHANAAFRELEALVSAWVDGPLVGQHISALCPSMAAVAAGAPFPAELRVDVGERILQLRPRSAGTGWVVTVLDVTEMRTMERFIGVVEQSVISVSGQLSHAARTLDGTSGGLVEAADETRRSMEEVVAYTTQLCGRFNEVVENAEVAGRKVKAKASSATAAAERTRTRSAAASELSELLADRASSATLFVKRIVRVMRATGMVAFNARIEAHRLGEHASEFGTIADDVKRLARTTGDTCTSINDSLMEIARAAPQSASITEEIRRVVDDMHDVVGDIAQALDRQSMKLRGLGDELSSSDDSMLSRMDAVREHAAASDAQAGTLGDLSLEIGAAAAALKTVVRRFGDLSVVRPDDVFRLVRITLVLLDATLQHTAPALVPKVRQVQLRHFEGKHPGDVIVAAAEAARRYHGLLGGDRAAPVAPDGPITPTQVLMFMERLVELALEGAKAAGVRSPKKLLAEPPVDGKTPSDVFGQVDLLLRRLGSVGG